MGGYSSEWVIQIRWHNNCGLTVWQQLDVPLSVKHCWGLDMHPEVWMNMIKDLNSSDVKCKNIVILQRNKKNAKKCLNKNIKRLYAPLYLRTMNVSLSHFKIFATSLIFQVSHESFVLYKLDQCAYFLASYFVHSKLRITCVRCNHTKFTKNI